MRLLFAALAIAVPVAVLAPMPATAAVVPAPASDAEQAAAAITPDAMMTRLVMQGLQGAFRKRMLESGDDLYARYPDLEAALLAQIQPEVAQMVGEALPTLRRDLAALLTAQMAPVELAQLRAFFVSPTGQKLFAGVAESVGNAAVAGGPVGTEAQRTRAIMADLRPNLTQADFDVLDRFMRTGAGVKFNGLGAELKALSSNWVRQLLTEKGGAVMEIAQQMFAEYRARPAGGSE